MKKIRVLLADDHAMVREGLKALLSSQDDVEVVGEVANGLQVLEAANGYAPDIVVMDISMPELNGVETTKKLRNMHPDILIIILSVHEEAGYLRSLLAAGVAGYVLKRSASETLVSAIRSVADGGVYLDPAFSSTLAQTVGGALRTLHAPSLSERETNVLRLIALGYSNKEIAAQLNLSVKTVETYKARAMQKLELNSRVAIVEYAAQQGWI